MQKKRFLPSVLPLALFFLSACSYTPWQESPLSPQEVGTVPMILQEMQETTGGEGFDADATITLSTTIGNHTYQGYLAALQPDYSKFVVNSPLGQPLLIATTVSGELTFIDVFAQSYSQKKLTPLLKEYDLPQNILTDGVANILGAYLPQNFTPPFSYFKDKEHRGIWVQGSNGQESLLIDPEKKHILARRITDEKEQLDITYSYDRGQYSLPNTISISGLSYGSKVTVQLKKGAKTNTFTPLMFTIRPPSFFKKVQ